MVLGGLVTLFVRDANVAVRFYIETLGMKLVASREGAEVIDAGDGFLLELRGLGGVMPPMLKNVPLVTFYAKVPLAEALAIYENRGVVFDAEGRFADPDGNALRLAARSVV